MSVQGQTGRSTKTYRQIRAYADGIGYDIEKNELTVPIEFGYSVVFKLNPMVAINNQDPWANGVPELQTNIMAQPLQIKKSDKSKSREEILAALKERNVIPPGLQYEDFTIGFVYAQNTNPNNHKWMLEYRKNSQIFSAMHFLGVNTKCPLSTTSWHDGIYHGRFVANANDVKMVLEDKPGYVTIVGNKENQHNAKGDVSKIPAKCEDIRFRFNVKTDIWWIDFLDEFQGSAVGPAMKCKNILVDAPLEGYIEWAQPKPKVTMHAKPKDIAEFSQMGDTVIIKGR